MYNKSQRAPAVLVPDTMQRQVEEAMNSTGLSIDAIVYDALNAWLAFGKDYQESAAYVAAELPSAFTPDMTRDSVVSPPAATASFHFSARKPS